MPNDEPHGADAPPRTHGAAGAGVSVVLSLLAVFGPISMDLYLPVLPQLAHQLQSTTSAAQLTITACLLGLAFGQVIAGPLSDRFGRRRPMIAGVALFVVASMLCAAAPNVTVLVLLRLLQGLAGGVGIVIAQATGRDLYVGGTLIRYYGRLTVIAGLAAIVGPVIGGLLASAVDWRGVFVFLGIVGALILTAGFVLFRETLPREQRSTHGLHGVARSFAALLSDRLFLGMLLLGAFLNAAIFAYLSGATFLLQEVYGLTPQGYSLAFALNSTGFMVCGFLAGRAAEQWGERLVVGVGLALCVVGSTGLVMTGLLRWPAIGVILSLLLMVSGVATTTPPATALALRRYPHIAGTAASLLGVARYLFGAISAPLVGLGPQGTALPLGIVTFSSVVLALAAFLILGRAGTARPSRTTPIRQGDPA